MEHVMAGIHGAVWHPPDWWEKWIDGQIQLSVAFEVASFGGEIHFYVRTVEITGMRWNPAFILSIRKQNFSKWKIT